MSLDDVMDSRGKYLSKPVLSAVDALYASVLEPSQRTHVSANLIDGIGARIAVFWCLSTDLACARGYDFGDGAVFREYMEHWAGRDGIIHSVLTHFQGQVVDMEMLSKERTDFHTEPAFLGFYEPNDLINAAGRFNSFAPGWIGGIAILRGRQEGPFTEQEKAVLESLGPHVDRSLRLSQHLHTLEMRNEGVNRILNDAQLVAVACTPSRLVLDCNPAGEYALRSHKFGLTIRHERLDFDDVGARELLYAALQQVGHGTNMPCEFQLPDQEFGTAWCTVLPLPSGAYAPGTATSNALLLLETRKDRQVVSAERIIRTFDVSPAESDILSRFMRGEDPVAVAEARGCTRETIRSYEKSLRAKLRCHSRAALVAKAWATLAAVPGARAYR